eukprot:jgi/Mesen1/131/ME1127309C07642
MGTRNKRGCDLIAADRGQHGVAFWEQADFQGVLGLLLAVQRQPVVVTLEGDQDSFINYSGNDVYDDFRCFLNGVVDHAVLVVGYNLAADTPYWIVRNSWGPGWGDNGHMYIALIGGDGVCGMLSTPPSYPVVRGVCKEKATLEI